MSWGSWLRSWLAAVAWTGVWVLLVTARTSLWSGPSTERQELWSSLAARPDGQFILSQKRCRLSGGGMGWHGPQYADLDRRPLAYVEGVRELRGVLPAPGPSPAVCELLRYFNPTYGERQAPTYLAGWLPGHGRQRHVLPLKLDEHYRDADGNQAAPSSVRPPRERWRIVSDGTGRRFHLVGWRHDQGQSAPGVWFTRRGFTESAPRPEDWFEGSGDLEARCQAANPDRRLRTGLDQGQAWPQPASWLVCADGGLLSVDPCSRRWRTLLPPCGVRAIAESGPAAEVLPRAEGKAPGTVVAALAGEMLVVIDRRDDRILRHRLPAELRGQPGWFAVLADHSIAAAPATEQLVTGRQTMGRLRTGKPLVGLRFAPDGQVLDRVSVLADEEPAPIPTSRILLTATCPLLPAWRQTAQYSHSGVKEGLALAWRVNLVVAAVLLWRTGSCGWALTGLLFGLPGLLAWLTHGARQPRLPRRRCPPQRGRPGRRPLLRLAGKEVAELWAGWAVGVGVLLWVARQGWGPADYNAGPARMVPCVGVAAAVLAVWLALAQIKREPWPWLLARPCDRGPLLVTKALVGCGLVLLATALVATYDTVDSAWPGLACGPVTWSMLRPIWLLVPVAGSVYLLSFACALGASSLPSRLAGRWAVAAAALLAATGWLLVTSLGPWPQPDPSPLHEQPADHSIGGGKTAGHDLSAWLTVADDGCPILHSIDSSHARGMPDNVFDDLFGEHHHRSVGYASGWQRVPPPPPPLAAAKPADRTIFQPLMPLGSGHHWYVVCRPPTLRRYHLVYKHLRAMFVVLPLGGTPGRCCKGYHDG